MSSSLEIIKETKESSTNSGLSLFDQLKNSKDHNNVNKVATIKTKNCDDKPKNENEKIKLKTELNNSLTANSNNTTVDIDPKLPASTLLPIKEKPEFYPPSLPASSQSSAGGIGIVQGTKRTNSQNSVNTNIFGLIKPSPRDLNTLPQSLKRSQHNSSHVQHATKKTALSSTKSLGNLQSTTSLSSLAAVFKSVPLSGDPLHYHYHHKQQQQQQQQNNKKKRCTDRYDSSESSDSGVATSLSCTDSSTASSEDASEPGSPYSPPHLCLNEEQQIKQHQLALNSNNTNTLTSTTSNNMLTTNSNKSTGGTAHTTISSTAAVSTATTTTSFTSTSSSSSPPTSSSLSVRTNTLPPSLTITPTSCSANAGHGHNKAKHLHHTTTLTTTNAKNSNNNTATLRCSNLPTLQWPWSTTTATSTAASSSPLSVTIGANTSSTTANTSTSATSSVAVTSSIPATTGNSTTATCTTSSNTSTSQTKKRTIAPYTVSDITSAPTAAKKTRVANSHGAAQDATNTNTLTNHTNVGAKRLKAAALEESQTKITGYFKSQMKAQIQAAHSKNSNVACSGTGSSSTNSSITTNALTMSAPATTASLNKYFNILAQLKENNKQTNVSGNTASNQVNKANTFSNNNNNNFSSIVNTSSVPQSSPISTSVVNTVATSQSNVSTVITPTTASTFLAANTKPMSNLSLQPVPMPALKKIERPKPTKIAQVAPNLRKTPTSSHNSYNHHSNSTTGKSPAKKHVAIAPRTPEMKQQMQQQQQQLLAIKQDIAKQQINLINGASASQSTANLTSANSTPQPAPAVLLTAIRLPTAQPQTQPQTMASKTPLAPNKLAQSTNNPTATPTTTNAVPPPPAATLYQLPTVQLPNLVQLPQLLAANGANIMQLSNLAAAANLAKNAQANAQQNANNTTTANGTHSTQQAAQAAAAQYFLNGTVFKLQQFTTATTTTATSAMGAPANTGNPFNLLSAADLQDMLIKQQQQQQQLQQLQQQQKANLNSLTAASANSFQEIFQQQIAAAIAANQQQQQQQAQLQHLQRLGAAANIQQQPVFMATPAGLLLNAASLPAMLAQAAAALAVNNHQQQQQHQQKAMALPALQPIQSAPLPALSSIFAPQQQQTGDQQQQELQHQQLQQLALAQQQFINSTQPPPLATVALSTTSQQQQQQHQQQSQQLTHNNNNNSSNITTISNNLQTTSQQQLNVPIMGAVASVNVTAATTTTATNNTAKLAIVKANNNVLPNNYTTLNSQPPPLVTISNRTHKTMNCSNNTTSTSSNSNTSSKANQNANNKPYQKRSSGSKQQNLSGKSMNKSHGGKITTASGKIIATPTTPPPLVPTITTAPQQPVALTSAPAKGTRTANLTKTNNIMPTPALVSISNTSTTAVQPKATQSLGGNSVTISPVVPAPKTNQLVNIAPKLTSMASSTQALNMKQGIAMNLSSSSNSIPINMGTHIPTSVANTSTSTTKTKANISSSCSSTKAATISNTTPTDLFDLVKNSNGAISITPAPITTTAQVTTPTIPPPLKLTSQFAQSNNFKSVVSSTSLTPNVTNKPLEILSKIKVEPLDEQTNNVIIKEKEAVKNENPTSFSGQIPANLKIKEELELMSTTNKLEDEEMEKSLSSQPNNILNNECSSSSSSFSSNSTSVSSAADLSLEASTPASITSSDGNSPQCSILSPLNSTCPTTVTPNSCSNSNSVSDSSSSNSCATGPSSRDMLSEMVTSSCISSDSSESSISVSLPENDESKLSSSEDKSASSTQENEKQPRDVPTPESGIGGSLSNIESMDSSSKSSSGEISSSASSSDSTSSEIINSPEPSQSDTQTPPATPMIQDSQSNEESQNETSSVASSLSQSQQSQVLRNSKSMSSSPSSSLKSFDLLSTTVDIKLAEAFTKDAPKSAISPILSQPKTIRFPANGGKGNKRQDGLCYWNKCNKKHESNSKLLDHMQHQHVNTQTGPFSCLWVGCKVYQKESCSRRWLERHVLSHGGSKQFKCIVEGCGLRFGSQLALQKHVNNHFTATESKESTSKRTSDPPVPKQLRKNGKKLRYRRQPFSARMFDFFDAGIMEGLQHRLRQISTLTNGCNSITFKGQCIMKRRNFAGNVECFVQWSPREIISDEWLPESTEPFLKTVNIKQMKPSEKIKVESLLTAAYKMPYSPTIFEDDYAMCQQQHSGFHSNGHNIELCRKQTKVNDNFIKPRECDNNDQLGAQQQEDEEDIDEEDDDDDDDENENEDDDDEDATTTTSSYQNVSTITNILQMQQHKKHPRKPQSRIVITR